MVGFCFINVEISIKMTSIIGEQKVKSEKMRNMILARKIMHQNLIRRNKFQKQKQITFVSYPNLFFLSNTISYY